MMLCVLLLSDVNFVQVSNIHTQLGFPKMQESIFGAMLGITIFDKSLTNFTS